MWGAAPCRGGRLLGRVQSPGAENHLLGHDGGEDLRHHRWVLHPPHRAGGSWVFPPPCHHSLRRVGWLPACGHRPQHPPRPLPHLLWLPGCCAAQVSAGGHPGEMGEAPGSARPPQTPWYPPGTFPRVAPPQLLTCKISSPACFRGGQGRQPGGGPSRRPPPHPPGLPPGPRVPAPRGRPSIRGGRRCGGRSSAE